MSALAAVTPMRPVPEGVYLSPEQVCELVPGVTIEGLKAMRKTGKGPRYSKPAGERGHVTIYRRSDVIAWVEAAFRSTREQS